MDKMSNIKTRLKIFSWRNTSCRTGRGVTVVFVSDVMLNIDTTTHHIHLESENSSQEIRKRRDMKQNATAASGRPAAEFKIT